jgi:short-subunit dehydrogenase
LRKTILITGASSGLGEGMAREFAARGRDLALCARRVDRLDALRDELAAAHPGIRVRTAALDVTDHDRVLQVFREMADALGGLDRVIVNAGIGEGKRIGTGHAEANLRTLQTNLVAALAQCEAAVEHFRARGRGHLVAVSSVAGVRGLPGRLTAYAASKAGLTALAEGIRAELLATDIRVTTLVPGYIRTEMNAHAARLPFEIDAARGAALMVRAIEREPATAFVPAWPWTAVASMLRRAPLAAVARWA